MATEIDRQTGAMGRRDFLRAAAIGSAVGCAFCLSAARVNAQHATDGAPPAHWGYEGEAGPTHWGELSPDFKACQLGLEQSPLDLANGITAGLGGVDPAYRTIPLRIINNGHTIQVNADPGCACIIGGTRYELQQFHFHHPSEHLLSGKPFDLECHLVHRSAAGDLAVLGILMKPGRENRTLQPIWNAMPRSEGPERNTGTSIDPATLLPAHRGYFRYMGSLTTPPCSEGITWTIFREAVEVSPDQIRQFASLFPNNARPPQARNRRYLLRSG